MPVEQINWRTEFDALRPYVERRGGVVHVRYSGDRCAPNAFLETLKRAFETFGDRIPRASIRIDRDFYTTHYLGGVLQAIAKKIDCPLEPATRGIEELIVASGNESKGNMDVTVENIHIHTADNSDAPILRDRRIAAVCKAIRDHLSTGRLMIVLNDASATDQMEFWRDLWNGGLKDLVDDGLLLVKMIDEAKADRERHLDEPQPTETLILPVEFDESRQQQAVEDLALILIREVYRTKKIDLPRESAVMSVKAFIYAHKRSISRLHNEWSGVLLDLVKDAK